MVYFQQRSLTIAAAQIMPVLALTQMQIGWLQWAFVVSYGCLQLAGGITGQRWGARRTLVTTGLAAVAATVAVPLAPTVLSGTALFTALLIAQFALGAAHAPFFPVTAGVLQVWLPSKRWALAQGVQQFGAQCGAALAPPIIAFLMEAFGWQRALFWTSLSALGLIALWAWYARNTPQAHPSVSAAELATLDDRVNAPPDIKVNIRRILRLAGQRNIYLLTISYICMNYVFYLLSNWTFLYLIQERHFAILESGWLAALPPLGAALGSAAGGWLTDISFAHVGLRWGYRLVPLFALPGAAVLLCIAVYSGNAYISVAALALCFTSIELTEGAYWASTMRIAQGDTMTAGGILNTGGNFGGIIGIPLAAYFSGHQAWDAAFNIGIAFALTAAITWFGVDVTRIRPEQAT